MKSDYKTVATLTIKKVRWAWRWWKPIVYLEVARGKEVAKVGLLTGDKLDINSFKLKKGLDK